jgi:error-prone DNA polymerase
VADSSDIAMNRLMKTFFTHLHVASGYSFKYGTALPHQLVEQAAENGATALALTDRDGMAGAIRFAQSCEANGIAPILGVDLPFLQRKYRVTVFAQPGSLDALYRLLTSINFSEEKILTFQTLRESSQYSSRLILMHGAYSQLGATINARRYEEALSILASTSDLFASQVIETTSHLRSGVGLFSTTYAAKMLGFARDHGIPALLTNAVRMRDRKDGPIADVLDAARQLVPLHHKHVERSNSEAYLKNPAEMAWVADEIARSAGERNGNRLLADTEEFAQKILLSPRSDIGLGAIHLPRVEDVSELRRRSVAGLTKYTGELSVSAAKRLEEELATVTTLGFEPYFLTVADIADMARARGIRVAARGSGAGSLICYLLGISGVEPISQGLLMERFCSVLRAELPDIDIDVESHRRLEIYDAVFSRYGFKDERYKPGDNSATATVAMVETYRARHAIRDVGAALGIAPMEIDMIAKSMPHIRARNISAALENLPELKKLKLDTPLLKMAVNLASRLDGLPRHLSMHPCAVVLSDSNLLDYAPLEMNASGYPMLHFDKDDVEAIGLLKLDILGVRMQSAISYALTEIKRLNDSDNDNSDNSADVDIDAIALNDPATFDLVKSTRTLGVFQIESPGQRELIGKFAPNTFTDLIIDISLFRPGPVKSDMITPFLNGRAGLKSRALIHPNLHDVLRETEGVVVFHEQVIRIISIMGGVTLAEGDERRRQMGTPDGQVEVRDWFYPAAIALGYDTQVIDEVWDILRSFASFGFCKAHAAAFALPTYQSAWLKTHHTAPFFAGLLTHDPGMYPKRLILDDARQWGITIAPIDINKSDRTYRVERTDSATRLPYSAPDLASTGASLKLPDARGYAIRMALSDIQGISEAELDSILSARPYSDLADFVARSGASRPICEALILVGAFDQIHLSAENSLNHRDLLLHLQDLYRLTSNSGNTRHARGGKQTTGGAQMLLGLTPPALMSSGLPDLTSAERVSNEVHLTGMDISRHMLDFYGEFLNHVGAIKSADLIRQRAGSSVLVAGVKVALQMPPIRSGKRVIFLTLDDGYGCNDITFFEDIQQSHSSLLFASTLFLIRGEIRRTGPRGLSLRATDAWELTDSYNKWRNLRFCDNKK